MTIGNKSYTLKQQLLPAIPKQNALTLHHEPSCLINPHAFRDTAIYQTVTTVRLISASIDNGRDRVPGSESTGNLTLPMHEEPSLTPPSNVESLRPPPTDSLGPC